MDGLTRRQLLRAGATGTIATGMVTIAGTTAAGAADQRVGGIHIHASLRQTAGLGDFGRIIDIIVYGTDDDLSGFGWDANPKSKGSHEPGTPDRTQCFSAQRGTVRGDVVHLNGVNLFWHYPGDDGAPVTTEANLVTGHIKWLTTPAHGTLVFEGTGLVQRI